MAGYSHTLEPLARFNLQCVFPYPLGRASCDVVPSAVLGASGPEHEDPMEGAVPTTAAERHMRLIWFTDCSMGRHRK